MKPKERLPEGSEGKTEASGSTPMERFRNLTRGLLKVTTKQVNAEQRRYEKRDKDKRRPTLTSS